MKDLLGIACWIFLESCSSWIARVFVPAVATMFLVVSVAGADEVKLAGGDVLRGTVMEQTDTYVVLEHSALRLVQIPRGKITSLVVGKPLAQQSGGEAPAEKKDKRNPRRLKWSGSHI